MDNRTIFALILAVLILFCASLVFLLILVLLNRRDRSDLIPYLAMKRLMTDNEVEFFQQLVRALPNYLVFPQVALNALITTQGWLPEDSYFRLRNLFDKKIVDYVICNCKDYSVVAIIELDDQTHKNKKWKDKKRDEMLAVAGYSKVIRYSTQNKPTELQIAQDIIS